jgi:hypothetical protein
MKKWFSLFLIFPSLALAGHQTRLFDVLVRNENNRPVIKKVLLDDLISGDRFDGEHFVVVRGKSDVAIGLDDGPELLFRAATVYHHLTIARKYFINHLKSEYVSKMPKLVIRIDHSNQFSELGHFAHDNLDPQFNNALTIPAGEGLSSRGVKPWGMEIWFRPSKKIHLRDLKTNNLANREFTSLMSGFRNQMHMQSLQRFLLGTVSALTKEGALSPLASENLVRTVGSSVILETSYQLIDPLTKLFSRKWYWLDTAVVPEIIYHEYAHAALSDHLELSHSTATIEGMADFFAAQIADSPKLAMQIKKYNTYNGKNAKRKQDYMIQFEMTDFANTDFLFGVLWELKNILGEKKGELFMFELRKKITTNSSIRGEFVEGLIKTCDDHCTNPFTDKIRILKSLNLRGI